jgi:N-acylneuraminate cytidylyltransferase
MSTIAFIFARGGSKGVPNKNLREINGKPLIGHAIEQAKQSSLIDRVVVSSDSLRILNAAAAYGALTITRPSYLAQDDSPEFDAWKHAIEFFKFDTFVNVPCTCPLRSVEDINKTIMCIPDADVAFTVTKINEFIVGKDVEDNRQDLPLRHVVVGSCFAATPKYIREHDSIWDGLYATVEVPQERALDIDTEFDFRVAKLLMEAI